ncbi:MAG: SH3 domain-containing protein, partial [Deltaproteobacteria bacterium]|nr:SH3 domain-containing protein [Deltaproteobacteria bacterium]
GACATPPHSPEGDHYLTTDMTYLRDASTFDSNVVGQLYKGDQVEKLAVGPAGWWRVRSGRTGQVGWVAADLFSPTPVPVPRFVVTQTVNLRECPKDLCPSLQLLSRGDQVQKIEPNDQGWWRVLVIESRNLGWLPGKTLAENLEEAEAAEKPYLYVAVRRLKLLRQPQPEAEVVKLLQVNDQVEKLDQNPAGWVKIRQPASGAVGWVQGRYLEPLPVAHPRPEKSKKRKVQPQKPPGWHRLPVGDSQAGSLRYYRYPAGPKISKIRASLAE